MFTLLQDENWMTLVLSSLFSAYLRSQMDPQKPVFNAILDFKRHHPPLLCIVWGPQRLSSCSELCKHLIVSNLLVMLKLKASYYDKWLVQNVTEEVHTVGRYRLQHCCGFELHGGLWASPKAPKPRSLSIYHLQPVAGAPQSSASFVWVF